MDKIIGFLVVGVISYAFWRLIRWLDRIFVEGRGDQSLERSHITMDDDKASRLSKTAILSLLLLVAGLALVVLGYSFYLDNNVQINKQFISLLTLLIPLGFFIMIWAIPCMISRVLKKYDIQGIRVCKKLYDWDTLWGWFLGCVVFAFLAAFASGVSVNIYKNFWDILAFGLAFLVLFGTIVVLPAVTYEVIKKALIHRELYVDYPKYNKTAWALNAGAFVAALVLFFITPSFDYLRYGYKPFGLNFHSTVHDYKMATDSERWSWSDRMWSHANDICMSSRASSCGHWITDDNRSEFRDCAIDSIQQADSNKKIGEICQECLIKPTFYYKSPWNQDDKRSCRY